jgi:1-acyl-sn-glycerol-3-phosphate acyltransferase
LLAHVIKGFFTILLLFPRLPKEGRSMRVLTWSQTLMRVMGIRFATNLPAHQIANPDYYRSAFFAGNHISWLDIHVLQAVAPTRFVAKSELGEWPLVHRMIRASGAMFVDREKRRDVARINTLLVEAMVEGDCVAVFPEGTTSDGRGLLPFYANLIQAAVAGAQEAPVKLIPFALRYENAAGHYSAAPTYIGDDTMLDSIWRTTGEPQLTARVLFGEPIPLLGRNRKDVTRDVEEAVQRLMGLR